MSTTLRLYRMFWASALLLLPAVSGRAQTELIFNGGFESGPSGWVLSGSPYSALVTSYGGLARSGAYYLWLGGAISDADAAYQTVTIPSGVTAATLSFYYNIDSVEGPFVAYDFFTVTIRNTSGAVLATVGSWSNIDQDPGGGNPYYHLKTFNLLPFAGQTIRIYFTSSNDSSWVTSFLVDDVSVRVTTGGTPNLAPYQPYGWSDKIVVANTTGTTIDSTWLTTADTLYVNWAIIDNGTAGVGNTFYTYLYVDGAFKDSWYTPSLNSGYYADVNDYAIGSLSPGTHTVSITTDATGVITESNESDNTYTKTITVYAPNLAPYQPSGWSDKIVVSTTTGTTTDSAALSAADTLYVDWSIINNGSAATASRFHTALYVDGVLKNSWYTDPPLAADETSSANDYSIGSLSAGTHTITITTDSTGTIVESDEGDNSYTKTINVQSLLPAPALLTPANGSTGQSVTPSFTWSPVSGATSYRIMVATNAADLPSNPTVSTGGPSVVINVTNTGTSYVPSTALNSATTYYWQVQGRNATPYGTWSGVNSFATVLPSIRISPLTLNFTGAAPALAQSLAAAESSGVPVPSAEQVLASVALDEKLADAPSILQGFTDSATVSVIAHVATPGAASGTDFSSASSLLALRGEVSKAQQKVFDSLPSADVKVRHRFENIAAFSAEITPAGLKALQAHPSVIAIEPVFTLKPHLAQGIPLIHGMTYRSSYNGAGMAIAICDTGVDYNHARLGGGGFPNSKVIGGYNFGDGTSDPLPAGNAHGTACAGIVAGDLGTVGDYIGGVAYNAKLYALKITVGGNETTSSDALVAAWDWCVTHKNDNPNYPILVISTSFGGSRFFSNCDSAAPSLTLAANNAVAAGITVLASSGNDGYCDSISWPACLSSVISVGAVYDAAFGTYQPCVNSNSCVQKYAGSCATGYYAVDNTAADEVTSYANTASFLTLLAPGNRCYTLDITGPAGSTSGDYYDSFGGTSAACPYAAGAVACLQAAAKARTGSFLSPQEVKNRLVVSGDNITDTKAPFTKPRVNLERAIESLPAAGQTFRIYNDGAGKLTVNSIATETSAPWITLAPAGPFDLAPGGYRDVAVSVDLSQAPVGQSSVRLVVTSTDSSKSPYPGGVYVNVTRYVPVISVTPASQDFGSVQAGTTADRSFLVQNTGDGTLSGSASVAAPFSILSGSPYSLGASQSVTVTIRYSPNSAGSDNQTVSFSGGGGATRQVTGSSYLAPAARPQLGGPVLSNGVFRFVLSGTAGSNYVVQFSSNLVNWVALSTNTVLGSGSVPVSDTSITNQPRRFYRALSP